MKKLEKRNGYYYLAGNYIDDIENEQGQLPVTRLRFEDVEVVEYDEEGVYFEVTGSSPAVYFEDVTGTCEYLSFEDI